MCQVLQVSRSGYYAWRKRAPSARKMANQALVAEIKAIFPQYRKSYGSPRMTKELRRRGYHCSENRVARLMRKHKVRVKQTKGFHSTTRPQKGASVASNILQRRFTAERPNQIWLADITYIPTESGFVYLAAVLDLYSRRIVGWAMDRHMTEALTIRALKMALEQRNLTTDIVHHSDQGRQYTSRAYQALLAKHGFVVSMNGVGTWYDNAPMESFFGSLKVETIYQSPYTTRQQAMLDVFAYIESFYNRHRLHSALDYQCPVAFEQSYFQFHLS
jgi:transposase InsO family protein